MNTVEPIRDWDLLLDIQDYLETKKSKRNYVLFMSGLHLGLRISDILKLRVSDVKNKDYITLREKKTGKENRIAINEELREIYDEYVSCKPRNRFLFIDERNFQEPKKSKPITRQQVWNILQGVAKHFEYKDPIGCHTLRKTFGYWIFERDPDNLMTLKELLNHSDISETKRYIGINQDSKDKVVKDMSFRGRCPKKR